MKMKNPRPYEALLVAAAFVMYVAQRLFNLSKEIDGKVNTAFEEIAKEFPDESGVLKITGYFSEDLRHYAFPIVAGAALLLAAWLIFHLLVWPKIRQPEQQKSLVLAGGLVVFLVFASLFVFHWNMTYLRYTRDEWGHITGLKTYSLYRKKTVLGDAIGIGFLFVFYELVSAAFRRAQRLFLSEKESFFSILAYIVPFVPAAVLFFLAQDTSVPTPLWSGDMKFEIWLISSIVFVWAMQEYVIQFLIPNYKAPIKIFLPFLFVFIVVFLAGNTLIWEADTNFYFYNYRSPFASRSFQKQLFRMLGSVLTIVVFRKMIFKEKTVLQRQVAGTSAELAQLRSQINPHFLFNALNSLYAAAMKENADKTADGIQRLGDMMRFMLQENNLERISVEKEIEYLHNYIHLQRIRVDETQGIEIKVVLNQPANDVYIAPMMLIPFVENAFKHGISHRFPSWIFITLSFDAAHLYFRVQNSKHIRHENDPEEYQSGIGMQNVAKRLQLLYPGRHTLQVQESDQDYIASLTLSLW